MAPGIFCIWSTTNPDITTRSDGSEETFSDAITAFPGVTRGFHMKQAEPNMMPPPYNHDVPFITVYHFSDAQIYQQREFKDLEKQFQSKKENAFMPRFYEEIVRIEEEGCENNLEIGELMAVWTAETPDDVPKFEKFHREVIVGNLRQSPNFMRARVYQQIGGFEPNEKVSSPFLFLHEWDSDELPWAELVDAAMTQEWQENIEGGLKWEGGCYYVKSRSRKEGELVNGKKGDNGIEVRVEAPGE
ncbi:hypothetical protein CC80DRAFT_555158 [Byssothecium circinans]|uniref:EthD domain-containing protein n=1 Tax=Byssothecium circinans TaxID=147558 RepID=A0A6A5TA57_9PLEO|nr:hypothetical protein CC80DRAFT_555158 [Byssothecium circinans]